MEFVSGLRLILSGVSLMLISYGHRLEAIWDCGHGAIEKLILLCLNSYLSGEGECFPSVSTIATRCGTSARTVNRAIRGLESEGVIKRVPRALEVGRQTSNLYKVDFSALKPMPCQIDRGEGVNLTGGGCQIDRGTKSIESLNKDLIQKKREEHAIGGNAHHFNSAPKIENAQHPPTVERSAKPDPLKAEIDREGECSASAAKNALGDAKLGLGSYASIDPDYKRFKGIYEAMTRVVNAHYGVRARAEEAWADCEATGLITSVFWEGLEVSIAAIKDEFKRTGRAIGVKSAANYLIDRDWEEALIRRDIQLQAKKAGVDLTSPQSVKAAGKQSERDKISQAAREILSRRAENA